MFKKQFSEVEDACALAQAMVDTVREPLIVLDKDLRVIAASQSFYVKFTTNPDNSRGKHLYELGDGQWDIPKLRALLENIIPGRRGMDDYEVEQDFPRIGKRVLLLNACIVLYEKAHKNILLSIEDITVQRALEHDKDELLRQKDVLLDEIEHRVANSLQIIASIIMMKAKSVDSEETRRHLHDAHHRVISVAAGGIAQCEQALALDRNLASAHGFIGVGKNFLGRPEETEAHIQEAFRLSPRDTTAYWWMVFVGNAKLQLNADAEAVTWLRRSIEANPNWPLSHFFLAAALTLLGSLDEARAAAQAGLALDPGFTLRRFRSLGASNNPTFLANAMRIAGGMRLAGVPEG
jgi:tetratricopeptide (TPR) repeat protein